MNACWSIFRNDVLEGTKDTTLRKHRPCRVDLRFTDGLLTAKCSLIYTKITSRIGLATYAILGYMLDPILVNFRAHLLPSRRQKKRPTNKSIFEPLFGVVLGCFLAPFWCPNGSQMRPDGLLGHPVVPLRFPRGSKGLQGRPGRSFLLILGAMFNHLGEYCCQQLGYVLLC